MKKIYLVAIRDGAVPAFPGNHVKGNEYLIECLAYEKKDDEHVFVHSFKTIKVKASFVESIREVSHEEALAIYLPPQKKERDPAEVIEKILKVIPPGNDSLCKALLAIQIDAGFLPPECKRPAWIRIRDVLTKSLLSPDDPEAQEWHKLISKIVRGVATDSKEKEPT